MYSSYTLMLLMLNSHYAVDVTEQERSIAFPVRQLKPVYQMRCQAL